MSEWTVGGRFRWRRRAGDVNSTSAKVDSIIASFCGEVANTLFPNGAISLTQRLQPPRPIALSLDMARAIHDALA